MIDFSRADVVACFLLVALLISGGAIFFLQRLLRTMSRTRREKQRSGENAGNPAVDRMESTEEASTDPLMNSPMKNPVASSVGNSAPLDFSGQLTRSTLERSLQVEVEHLRQEMQQLRVDMAHLATEMRQLKVAHNIAPLYAEAVTLAQQGISTAGIADRCGISLGEAELVAALAQSEARGGFDGKKQGRVAVSET
jgi:hypothetical protein